VNGNEHEGFARALRFLQYRRVHAWTALVGSVLLAFLIIVLLGLAGLFTAVLVSRGQLDEEDRQAFLQNGSEQRQWLETVLDPEDREALLQRTEQRQGVGLVALAWAARQRNSIWRPFLEAIIRWWSWTHDNYSLMLGLLLFGLLIALARCALQTLVHWSAAQATLEASTRLRRAVYLQTYRLGSLLLKRQGLTEAVSMFTRHVEAVQEGLYLWLTSRYREPVRLGLLVVFAPLVEIGATGAFRG
jgi:ABC-type multidrug transport system fused ATPase/permease subunit